MIPFILGALAAVSLSELSKRGKLPKMAKGGDVSEMDKRKYVIIHFKDREAIKRYYDCAYEAFCDYEEQGCVKAVLFDSRGIPLASYPKKLDSVEYNISLCEYRVIGTVRFYDEMEVDINETIIATSEDEAISKVKKRYIGAAPDSDLYAILEHVF